MKTFYNIFFKNKNCNCVFWTNFFGSAVEEKIQELKILFGLILLDKSIKNIIKN